MVDALPSCRYLPAWIWKVPTEADPEPDLLSVDWEITTQWIP
jgi:hypothetical protein